MNTKRKGDQVVPIRREIIRVIAQYPNFSFTSNKMARNLKSKGMECSVRSVSAKLNQLVQENFLEKFGTTLHYRMTTYGRRKTRNLRYILMHPDVVREIRRRYKRNHKEKIREASRQYYYRNQVKEIERSKRYNIGHREQVEERKREYRKMNREKINRQKREYYSRNRDRINKKRREKTTLESFCH